MPVAEPPCGACCYLFTDTPCGSCYSSCTDGGADLGAWLALPEVIVRAVLGLAAGASSHGSPAASASTRLAIRLIKGRDAHGHGRVTSSHTSISASTSGSTPASGG
ncbi:MULTISPECIES: hypothetical protein [Micromonospora]|uniref:hypothetical protein n=1 Tax=Micromonospora TaxID=1873 RepID=UPI00191C3DEC|nr:MULTISPECIES: hypothetical protein [unclassified Micromonospora]MBM0225089.1 hypothetical protein [Micromonospora sp. ATA51]